MTERSHPHQDIAELTKKERVTAYETLLVEKETALHTIDHERLLARVELLTTIKKDLIGSQAHVRDSYLARDAVMQDMNATKKRFEDFQLEAENKKVEMEKTINSRNHEIKLLMYRIQELSSKYDP